MSDQKAGETPERAMPDASEGPIYPPARLPLSVAKTATSKVPSSSEPESKPVSPAEQREPAGDLPADMMPQDRVFLTPDLPAPGSYPYMPDVLSPAQPFPAATEKPARIAAKPVSATGTSHLPLPPQPDPVFISDYTSTNDSLDRTTGLSTLSELLAHRHAQGPLSLALLGGPGEGKTHALNEIIEGAQALSGKAFSQTASSFISAIVTVRIDALDIADDPVAAVAERLHMQIVRQYPQAAQFAAEEATHLAMAPRRTARLFSEGLAEARRKLDLERSACEDTQTNLARLTETVLFESGSAQVETYARAQRSRIEPAMRALGFNSMDILGTYKGLVLGLTEAGSPASRLMASLRALWAYKGQKNRIAGGLSFMALAWLSNLLMRDRAWLQGLEGSSDTFYATALWIKNHLYILDYIRQCANIGALVCFASLFWRAWRFAHPVWSGAKLLDADIIRRKSELEHQLARHFQRVDSLTREADALAARATEAEQRAGGADNAPAYSLPLFIERDPTHAANARLYFVALDGAISGTGERPAGVLPGRIIITLDSLDRLLPAQALALYTALSGALTLPSFALVTAFDPDHFNTIQDARASAARLIQIPYRLKSVDDTRWPAFIDGLAGRKHKNNVSADRLEKMGGGSSLDLPLTDPERKLLAALSPLAGPAPRGVKQLVNLYRLARIEAQDDLAALAVMLALLIGGTEAEKRAVSEAVLSQQPDSAIFLPEQAGQRFEAGLEAAALAQGGAVSIASARRAYYIAKNWSL